MTLTPSAPRGALQLSLDPITASHRMGTVPTPTTDIPDMNAILTSDDDRSRLDDECTCACHSEKFVTRKEYDEIKDSLSRLETILTTTTPSGQGSSGSANEEVAAAVNMVKKQAGILGKVISNPSVSSSSAQPPSALRSRGQSVAYAEVPSSAPISTVPSSFSRPTYRGHPPDSGGGNSSFAYSPFSLNVPSQSPGGPRDAGDEDYYGATSGVRNAMGTHSHSTATEFPRSTTSTYQNPGRLQPMAGHFQSNIAESSYHGSNYPSQHQRVPEINLGGLVVEGQSHSSEALLRRNPTDIYKSPSSDPTGPLSTLANLANASSMMSSPHRPSATHIQPIQHHQQSQDLTLAPIGVQSISHAPRNPGLSISTSVAPAESPNTMPPPAIAPPRLPPADGGGNREAQLSRVLQVCLPRREVCDKLLEYYVRLFGPTEREKKKNDKFLLMCPLITV